MRGGDVIDVIVITRRHAGGILNVNKSRVNMRQSENSYTSRLFAKRVFD